MATKPKPKLAKVAVGSDTRDRIVEAAQRCLSTEGIAGASARAIARHGDFNQALIFYHFGSVDGLLQAAAREDAERRSALYADRLGDVTTLAELVSVGRQIHDVELEQGSTVVLTQLLAGSVASPTLAEAILDGMRPWTALVEDALRRVVADTALASVVPMEDLAFAISSLFLGMELMASLDTDHDRVAGLFTSLDSVTLLLDALLRSTTS
ncbi:MAG: TetR/AcrR family transcriptional regulator [Acidimicrobiia bacterium]|nr:TetR/AcrR family transcriptional regulator [Acidimicrobiia bacterium]